MEQTEKIQNYWRRFLADTGKDPGLAYSDCFYFGRTEEVANNLAALVVSGKKRATTSCFSSYEVNNEQLPEVGTLSVVTDWNGTPKCVIETTCVTVIPFKDVTFDICSREGEDDNLQSWQDTHFAIYQAEGREEGYHFTWETPVVFEDFQVVYR